MASDLPPPQPLGVRRPDRYRVLLALVLVVGATLRIIGLDEGLWYDEIGALVRYVRIPVTETIARFDTQNQHLLYSVLAHGPVSAFGETAWALRLPAAVFGVASLWAVWWLGAQIGDRREALIAAGLLSTSMHHVWFSQNARGYTMLTFFVLIGTGLFYRLLSGSASRSRIVGYAVTMALACWTQVAGAFVAVAHGMTWLWTMAPKAGRTGRSWWAGMAALVLAAVLTLLLYAPILGSMFKVLVGPKTTGGAPEWKSLLWFAVEVVQGLGRGLPGGYLTLIGASAVGLTGVVSIARRSAIVAQLLLLPVLVTAVAVLATSHNLWPRLFFFASGFAALIAVRGGFAVANRLFGLRGPMIATAGAVLIMVASAFTVPRAWAPKQDFGAARTWLDQARGPEDQVVTVDLTRLPYRDFYRTGWTPIDSLPDLLAVESRAPRTWVLYTFPERLAAVDSATWAHLQGYRPAISFPGTVAGGEIVIVRRP